MNPRLPLCLLAAAAVTAGAATSAAAATPTAAGHARVGRPSHTKPVGHTKPAPRPKPVPRPGQVRFTATGAVSGVDTAAGTLTVADTGGSPQLHGRTVTVTVPTTAVIQRDGTAATLADVTTGDRVTILGTATGGTLTATRIQDQTPATGSPDD